MIKRDVPTHPAPTALRKVPLRQGSAWLSQAESAEPRADWIQRLLNPASQAVRALKSETRNQTLLVHADDRHWVVKRYRLPWWKAWLYQTVKRTPAWREWRGAQRLSAAGARVARPAVLVHQPSEPWTQALILPYVEGENLAQYLGRPHPAVRRIGLARRIGRQIGQLAAAGLINRDHKATNLIVDRLCDTGQVPPVIIDPAGIRRRKSDHQIYRMLALLHYTCSQVGPVSLREVVACIRGVLETDRSIARTSPRRTRSVIEQVRQVGQQRYPACQW